MGAMSSAAAKPHDPNAPDGSSAQELLSKAREQMRQHAERMRHREAAPSALQPKMEFEAVLRDPHLGPGGASGGASGLGLGLGVQGVGYEWAPPSNRSGNEASGAVGGGGGWVGIGSWQAEQEAEATRIQRAAENRRRDRRDQVRLPALGPVGRSPSTKSLDRQVAGPGPKSSLALAAAAYGAPLAKSRRKPRRSRSRSRTNEGHPMV